MKAAQEHEGWNTGQITQDEQAPTMLMRRNT
jgi:hypothetical protein